jgi:hypothetical protein
MYKKRIAEWGLQKYTQRTRRKISDKEEEADVPASSRLGEDATQKRRRERSPPMLIRDHTRISFIAQKESLDKTLESYMRTRYPTIDYGQFIVMSRDLRNVEIILIQVDNYFQSYDMDMWHRNFPKTARGSIKEIPLCFNIDMVEQKAAVPMIVHPGELFNRFHMAAKLLELRNDPKANKIAWRVIFEAFDLVEKVIQQQHPQLLRYLFMQFWDSTYDVHPGIRDQLFVMLRKYAELLIGAQHPITQLTELLTKFDNKAQQELICELAWKRNLDTFDRLLGVSHDETLRSKMAITGNYIDSKRYHEAREMLSHVSNCFSEDSTEFYKRAALCRLAWITALEEKYAEAEEAFVDVMNRCQRWTREQEDPDTAIDDVYLATVTHLARLQARRNFYDGSHMLENALSRVCKAMGPEHAWTYTIRTELEILKNPLRTTTTDVS